MERLRHWIDDIWGGAASFMCWFTQAHCDHIATVLAMSIGFVTLFFITIPKAYITIKRCFRNKKWTIKNYKKCSLNMKV